MSIIALMTDFGTRDYYVGAMKGMILQINPKVTLVDITHEIAAQDLYHGAFVLRQSLICFPSGTIFIAIVDPGVGSERRILAARYSDRIVLAPDNGLLTLLHRDADLQEIRTVENRRFFASTLSSTFHGRDIFAPVAAHLSRGVPMADLGPVASRIEVLDLARPRFNADGTIEGQVILIDWFGNLITNISALDLARRQSSADSPRRDPQVSVKNQPIGPLRTTYADVSHGELVGVIGSAQMLEIAVNRGSAAQKLGAVRGDPVHVG